MGIAVGISQSKPALISSEDTGAENGKLMSIESYVSMNISELAPIKETMGGKFYVTDIEANDGVATVWYEDGHNAYIADFKYEMDEYKGIDVNSWNIRQ